MTALRHPDDLTSVLDGRARRPSPLATDLDTWCHTLFSSLGRRDQRQWAQLYLRGLVELTGRRSIRRIADEILGRPAEQSLQQFLNQSPWDWTPVRAEIAREASRTVAPRAWVVDEIALPKSGASSVGVERQFAAGPGRVLNCQLGATLSMTGDLASAPVDWRLMLPPSWDDDEHRRRRCRVPEGETARPRWRHVVDLVDEVRAWGEHPPPVVVDSRGERRVEPLLTALEARGLTYLVRVDPDTVARAGASRPGGLEPGTGPTARRLARDAARLRTVLVSVADDDGARRQLRTTSCPVPRAPVVVGRAASPLRRVFGAWNADGTGAPKVWLSNTPDADPLVLVGLSTLAERSRRTLANLDDGCGLQHFEGRSYRGWHHHTTLVSCAHGFRLHRARSAPTTRARSGEAAR